MAKNKPIFVALSRPASKMQDEQDDTTNGAAEVIAHVQGLVVTHREQLDAVRETVDKARQSLAEGELSDAAGLLALLSDTLEKSVAKHDAAIKEATAARALIGITDRVKQ